MLLFLLLHSRGKTLMIFPTMLLCCSRPTRSVWMWKLSLPWDYKHFCCLQFFFVLGSFCVCRKKYYLFMAVNSVDVLYLFPYFFFVSDSIIHATMKIHHPKLFPTLVLPRWEALQYMMDLFFVSPPSATTYTTAWWMGRVFSCFSNIY